MICCVKCFKDSEIIAIIESLEVKGDCEVCNQTDVFIYDTDQNNRLTELLEGLVEIYTPASEMPEELKKYRADFSLLKDELHTKWNLFNVDSSKAYELIIGICKGKYEQSPGLFEEAVGIRKMYDTEFKKTHSILKNATWKQFTEGIKHQNRFHIESFNAEVFRKIIGYASTTYEKGHIFYRARLSNERDIPFPTNEMGPPPKGMSTNGRVNPYGISCLYLASNEDIAIKEIRAGLHDNVTIAKFELLEKIEVIDFTMIDKFSPFLGADLDFNYEKYAVNKEHLVHIANEVLLPSKRGDSQLNYLPSQYISDFIKSRGRNGVKYQSTMDKTGFNIAVFDENLLDCREVSFHRVTEIYYKWE